MFLSLGEPRFYTHMENDACTTGKQSETALENERTDGGSENEGMGDMEGDISTL